MAKNYAPSVTKVDPLAEIELPETPTPSPQYNPISSKELEDGSIEIEVEMVEDGEEGVVGAILAETAKDAMLVDHNVNLAEHLEDEDLDEISINLSASVADDDASRSEWLSLTTDLIKYLGLSSYDKSELPHELAASVIHPLLLESVVNFQSKAFMELFPSKGPVKTRIMGMSTQERAQQATRVKDFMNYQVQHDMPEYGPDLDQALFYVGFLGNAFRKTYYDAVLGRITTRFIKPQDVIVHYDTVSLETSQRVTHKITIHENDLKRWQVKGFYRDIELTETPETTDDVQSEIDAIEGRTNVGSTDKVYELYETYVNLCIEDDPQCPGFAVPYIVTFEVGSGKILSIYRNWAEDDENYRPKQSLVKYGMIPGLGFYDYGYAHLIGGLSVTATGALRALLDAGAYSSFPAGFKTKGIRVLGGDTPLMPGEFRDIQTALPDVTKSFFIPPFKEPSPTLFNLLDFVTNLGRQFANSTDQAIADSPTYGPVGTVLAMIESTGKLTTAIHKRLHAAQMKDLKILHDLNYEWLPDQYPYEVAGGAKTAFKSDFDGRIDVIPVSDPALPTQAHRIAKANAIFTMATQSPQLHNMQEVLRHLYESMEIEQPERFLAQPAQAIPADPATENANSLKGIPLKAGPMQNHKAHVKAHQNFMQLPDVMQNPAVLQSMQAHIQDHIAQDYLTQIQSGIGIQIPQAQPGQPAQQLPPQVESMLAVKIAEATEQLLNGESNRLMEERKDAPEIEVAREGLEVEKLKTMLQATAKEAELAIKKLELTLKDGNEDATRDLKQYIAELQANLAIILQSIRSSEEVRRTYVTLKVNKDEAAKDRQISQASQLIKEGSATIREKMKTKAKNFDGRNTNVLGNV